MNRHIRIFAYSLILACFAALSGCGDSGLSSEQYVKRAEQSAASGDLKAAVIELKNALQQEPRNALARRMLGEYYLKLGDVAAAEAELARAIEYGDGQLSTRALLGRAWLLQSKHDRILQELTVAGTSAEDADLQVLRALAHLQAREIDKSEAIVREVLSRHADHSEARLTLARIELVRGRTEEGMRLVEQELAKHPKDVEAWRLKGLIYSQQGRHAEAKAAFEQVLVLSGEQSASTLTYFNTQLDLLSAEINLGNDEAAAALVKELIKREARAPSVQYFAGLLAYRKKEFETATTHLEQAVQGLPNHFQTLLLLGAVHFAQGNYEQADQYLARVVKLRPAYVPARKLLGSTRMILNRSSEAVEAMSPAVKGSEDSELLTMIGKAAAQSGDVRKGIDYLRRASKAKPDDHRIREGLAQLYLSQGAYEEAIQELEQITGEQQDRAQGLIVIAHLRQEKFDEARKLAQDLLQKDPRAANYMLAGGVELISGKREEARALFAQALKTDAKFTPALLSLARMDLDDDRLTEAQTKFEQILAQNPRHMSALVGLALVHDKRQDVQGALKWLELARERLPRAAQPRMLLASYYLRSNQAAKARDYAAEAAKFSPEDPAVQLMLARAQVRSGQREQALAIYQKLTEQRPQAEALWRELGQVRMQLQEWRGAQEALDKAVALNPDDLVARAGLVHVALAREDNALALKHARSVQAKIPDQAQGYHLLGDVYAATGDQAQARQFYEEAQKREATALVAIKLAQVLQQAGQQAQAQALLVAWLKDHPQDVPVRLTLGGLYEADGRLDAAIEVLQQAAQDHPVVTNNLAWVYYLKKDYAQALVLAQRAYDKAPDNGAIADTLGWLLAEQGKTEQGLKLLRKAHEALPGNADVQYHLAATLAKMGQPGEARRLLERALASKQSFSYRNEAQALLRRLAGPG